jgi:hypothetical protein
MSFSGMLRLVAPVRIDVSEERIASIMRVTRQCVYLQPANVVPSSLIFVALLMGEMSFSKTSVLTRVTRRNILEGVIRY